MVTKYTGYEINNIQKEKLGKGRRAVGKREKKEKVKTRKSMSVEYGGNREKSELDK